MTARNVDAVPWWREAVVYQIYPLSFADCNGDGFGDLRGATSKLPYLAETLGIDAIWFSPFYESPMKDWGYDVSDHTEVDPMFGDLDDAKRLIARAHELDLKVVVDYVINHTSDRHQWFEESQSSRENPKRDWYVWRDGRDGGPPNNWVSVFGGPAWRQDDSTDQWYRHTFLSEQPDLNWRNPEVAEAMLGVARFWLDLDVDGIRVDAAHYMMKDPRERDNPPAPPGLPRPWKPMGEFDRFLHLYDLGHPDVHDVHRQLRELADSYDRDVLTIGEMHIFDLPEWASYYGDDLDEFTMPFNFHLMASDWNASSVRAIVEAVLWNVPSGAWTNWVLGNHDETRMATRLPAGHERIAATLILTLRGTPFLYYGDELGMKESKLGSSRDPWGVNVAGLSRDGARTPMQWDNGPNAGFTSPDVAPWLPVDDSASTMNVVSQLADPGSILNMYRRLLSLRRTSTALRLGSFLTHPASTEHVFAYRREWNDEAMTIALNFGTGREAVPIGPGVLVFSSAGPGRDGSVGEGIELAPLEAVILTHTRSG